MITVFERSGKSTPCPVCSRTSDADCSSKHGGDVVFCHTHRSDDPFVVEGTGYKFSKETDAGAGWGIWYKPQPQKIGRSDREPQILHNYPARDGSQWIRVVRQKGGKIEFYQQYFIDGEWISPSEADRRGNRAHLESMKKLVPIYRYQEVREAIANGQPVVWAEGESVADALWLLGQPATTSIGGSKAFTRWGDYSKDLEGLGHLLVAPDIDKPGYEYSKKVRNFYQGKGVTVIKWLYAFPDFPQWKDLPESGGLDLKDEIQEGLSPEDLLARVGAAIANGIGYPMDEKPVDRSAYEKPEKKEQTYEEFMGLVREIATIKDYGERYFKLSQLGKKTGLPTKYLETQLGHCISESRGLLKGEILDLFDESEDDLTDPIIPNFLYRNNVSVIVSQPGTGKSLLAYDFAYQMITGGEFMDFPIEAKKVLLIQLDEDKGTCRARILSRLEEIYTKEMTPQEKDAFKRKCVEDNLQVRTKMNFRGMQAFSDALEECKPDIVIIDNFREVCKRSGAKENEQDAGELLGDLKTACQDYNAALLMIHHENKSGFAEGQNKSAGHGSIMGQCATAFTLSKPKGQQSDRSLRILTCIKNRLGDDSRLHEFSIEHSECSWKMAYRGEVDTGYGCRDKTVSDDLAAKILEMTVKLLENNPLLDEAYFSVLDIKRYSNIPDASHGCYAQLEFAEQRGLIKVRHERSQAGGKLRKFYAINTKNIFRMREMLRIGELVYLQGFQNLVDQLNCSELTQFTEGIRAKLPPRIPHHLSNYKLMEIQRDRSNSQDSEQFKTPEPLVNNQFINSSSFSTFPEKDVKPKISTDLSKVDPNLKKVMFEGKPFCVGGFVQAVGRKGPDQITGLGKTKEGHPFALLALEQRKFLLSDLDLISVPFGMTE